MSYKDPVWQIFGLRNNKTAKAGVAAEKTNMTYKEQ
jgi:hypothetical protein